MRKQFLVIVLSAVFLSGCATLGKGQDPEIQQLQGRVNSLELELERKNREIETLENELEARSSRSVRAVERPDIVHEPAQLSKKQIQEALKNAGFYEGPIDGKIGLKSKDAILAFQKENGLKVDGVVGPQTSSELRRYLNE